MFALEVTYIETMLEPVFACDSLEVPPFKMGSL